MTTFLYSVLTAGADKMAQTDPHGWTLTLISVGVVFCALIILYFVYSFSGAIFSGKIKFKFRKSRKSGKEADAATAAAIALALDDFCGNSDEKAAIALALHLYLTDSVHDMEPGVITIRKSAAPSWNSPEFRFRKYKSQ